MATKRTIITLSEADKKWLESYSRANDVSLAEAIRQGIRKLRETELVETYRATVQRTRGLWRRGDGLTYQRRLRSEWQR